MNIYDLIAEGEALSKPCFEITSGYKVNEVIGYWHKQRDHTLLILSETLLAWPKLNLFPYQSASPLRLRMDYSDSSIDHLSIPFSQVEPIGQPLYAIEALSFPHLEELVRYGSERVKAWAAESDEYGDYTRGSLVSQYEEEYQTRSIFYRQEWDVDLVAGGWSMAGWTTGNPPVWAENGPARERVHLFTTLRDAEPWYEAWYEVAINTLQLEWHVT